MRHIGKQKNKMLLIELVYAKLWGTSYYIFNMKYPMGVYSLFLLIALTLSYSKKLLRHQLQWRSF